MAAHQSSLLCAPPGLMLLLIGVISSHLPGVQARPINFWCNRSSREVMARRTEILMAVCVGSHPLPYPIQLPCVQVHTAEWTNKTLQQKYAEVIGDLQVFQDVVQGVRNQTTIQCQTSLIKTLTNYLNIVNSLRIQNGTLSPSHSAVQNCSKQTSLNEVLVQYRNLLKGKLEYLAIDLKDSICEVEHRTTNT